MHPARPLAPLNLAAVLLLLVPPVIAGERVIFISADGMRPDAVEALGPEGAPALHRLRSEGAWTGNARTDFVYTVTLPNHTAMITGRGVTGPEGHGWISNSDPKLGQNLHRNRGSYLSSMFAVAHDHGLATALYASKSKFSLYDISYDERTGEADTTGEDNGRDKIDRFLVNEDSSRLTDALLADLATAPSDLTMLHLRDPDSAGHADGWDLTPGSPYLRAVAKVDQLIGRILDAIDGSPELRGKTWILLTADHGGLTATKGHGEARESDNYTIPFYTWGPRVPAGGDLYALNPDTRENPGSINPPTTR